jgi:hypothetical protein
MHSSEMGRFFAGHASLRQTSHHAAAEVADYILMVGNEDDFHVSDHHFAEKVNGKIKVDYQFYGPPFNAKQSVCRSIVRLSGLRHVGDTCLLRKPHEAHL